MFAAYVISDVTFDGDVLGCSVKGGIVAGAEHDMFIDAKPLRASEGIVDHIHKVRRESGGAARAGNFRLVLCRAREVRLGTEYLKAYDDDTIDGIIEYLATADQLDHEDAMEALESVTDIDRRSLASELNATLARWAEDAGFKTKAYELNENSKLLTVALDVGEDGELSIGEGARKLIESVL